MIRNERRGKTTDIYHLIPVHSLNVSKETFPLSNRLTKTNAYWADSRKQVSGTLSGLVGFTASYGVVQRQFSFQLWKIIDDYERSWTVQMPPYSYVSEVAFNNLYNRINKPDTNISQML